MIEELSPRQSQVYNLVHESGVISDMQISKHFDISLMAARDALYRLKNKDLIRSKKLKGRRIVYFSVENYKKAKSYKKPKIPPISLARKARIKLTEKSI